MRIRLAAVTLLGLAAALYGGVEGPARVASQATREERRRLEVRLGELRARLGEFEGRWWASAAPDVPTETAIADLRRAAIEALAESDLAGVQLDVGAGRAPVAATLGLQARGATRVVLSFLDALALDAGVVIDSVRLRPTRNGALQLDVQGLRLGAAP